MDDTPSIFVSFEFPRTHDDHYTEIRISRQGRGVLDSLFLDIFAFPLDGLSPGSVGALASTDSILVFSPTPEASRSGTRSGTPPDSPLPAA